MTIPPDDELREFWERLVLVLRDSPDTAQVLHDSTVTGPGGRSPQRPPLPAVHAELLAIGKKGDRDWYPGEGYYTEFSAGEAPPVLLCNKCGSTGRVADGPCPWCGDLR